jgi:hypothetical protein
MNGLISTTPKPFRTRPGQGSRGSVCLRLLTRAPSALIRPPTTPRQHPSKDTGNRPGVAGHAPSPPIGVFLIALRGLDGHTFPH